MDRQKVDIFIKEKQFCFPQDEIEYIRNLLSELEEEKFEIISDIEFINPDFILLSSIYLGSLGVDRFMVVDIYLGF